MENFSSRNHESFMTPNIIFYRNAASAIASAEDAPSPSLDLSPLRMNAHQIEFSRSFIGRKYSRAMMPAELMLIDGYCGSISRSPHSVAMNELLLNDEFIAATYAALMRERHSRHPNSELHPTVKELADLIAAASRSGEANRFPYSELAAFSSFSDDRARLSCLASGCLPICTDDGVCIGKRLTVRQNDSSVSTAVIFAAVGQRPDDLRLFLESPKFVAARVFAEFCPTEDIFARLVDRYDEFHIDTLSLPIPRGRQYGGQPYFGNEVFAAEICEAFFTDTLFGDFAILIHGGHSAVRRLCDLAATLNLSSFNGIYCPRRSQSSAKKPLPPHVVGIDSRLFRFLPEPCDNISVTIPDHRTEETTLSEVMPLPRVIRQEGYDLFVTAKGSVSPSLPFHSGYYALLAPAAVALSHRNSGDGQLSVSVRLSLCFGDKESAGLSLSVLLGVYRAAMELSLPITDYCLELTDKDGLGVTATLHDFAPHSQISAEDVARVTCELLKNAELSPSNLPNSLDFSAKND